MLVTFIQQVIIKVKLVSRHLIIYIRNFASNMLTGQFKEVQNNQDMKLQLFLCSDTIISLHRVEDVNESLCHHVDAIREKGDQKEPKTQEKVKECYYHSEAKLSYTTIFEKRFSLLSS